ncbi:E3 ubiquitin-protein ligase ZNF598 isoform X8 [Oryctolagus cuniculus]|uniref:E3 ubiquitin-protein ligase ZNF598 isoform X8 n=1 Tax=Oryctolagus cuniculus TaxID=9986 RepID=UPI00387920AF
MLPLVWEDSDLRQVPAGQAQGSPGAPGLPGPWRLVGSSPTGRPAKPRRGNGRPPDHDHNTSTARCASAARAGPGLGTSGSVWRAGARPPPASARPGRKPRRPLPPGGAVAGRAGDVVRKGRARREARPCRAGRRGPEPGPWRRRRRRAPRGGVRPWRRRRRRRRRRPSGAAGAACCAAGTWRPRRWAAATTRCATAAPPRCGCCVSSATAPCAARSCARWSLGGSFRPSPPSPCSSCSTRRSTTSTLRMGRCLPCTGSCCSTSARGALSGRPSASSGTWSSTCGDSTSSSAASCACSTSRSSRTSASGTRARTWPGTACRGTPTTRPTAGTRSASSVTSATWTTTSCSSTCAVTTTSATSATPTERRTTTATTRICGSTSGSSTSCARRAAAARSSSPTPSAPRSTSRHTGRPATAAAAPRPARTARSTCSSAMRRGTPAAATGSSVARTTRRWTGTTARAEQAGPVGAEPSRAAEEAGGTRGRKRTGKSRPPSGPRWLCSSRRSTAGARTGRKAAGPRRRRRLLGARRSPAAPAACPGLRGKAQAPRKPQPTVPSAKKPSQLQGQPQGPPRRGFNSALLLKSTLPPPPPGLAPPVSKPPPGFSGLLPGPHLPCVPGPATTMKAPRLTPTPRAYLVPENFRERNLQLIQSIKDFLQSDEARFSKFKNHSGEFRQGMVSAAQYYKSCRDLLGENFQKIFNELLVLLPDTAKQQELLSAHADFRSRERPPGAKSKKNKKSAWQASTQQAGLDCCVCPTCQQVLAQGDVSSHQALHAARDDDFPSLQAIARVIT